MPDEGIIVAHSDFLPQHISYSSKRFIVEIKPDRRLRARNANFVILQNRRDPLQVGAARLVVPSGYVPYWPQPSLIPRDRARGDRFETVAYFGNSGQFLAEADLVSEQVRQLGLTFVMKPSAEWNDYEDTDAVVAVRPQFKPGHFDVDRSASFNPAQKPASKLVNAWLAGVPAVLSADPAYVELRRTALDYLEASDVTSIIASLKRLQTQPELRRAMSMNADLRAKEFSAVVVVEAWRGLLERRVFPAFEKWRSSSIRQYWHIAARHVADRCGLIP